MNSSFKFDTTELFGRVGSGLDLKFVGSGRVRVHTFSGRVGRGLNFFMSGRARASNNLSGRVRVQKVEPVQDSTAMLNNKDLPMIFK